MMCVEARRGALHSVYRPLVCLIRQGAKQLTVGCEQRVVHAGQSVIVSADMPVVGRIVRARAREPYLAVAVDLEITIVREVAEQLGRAPARRSSEKHSSFVEDTDAAILDCASRLLRLMDRPDAARLLPPGIMRELHYWLLSGQHGAALRALAVPGSYPSRLAAALAILRDKYRTRLTVQRLASAAAMSSSNFCKHFRKLTSLTPGRYQKRLRLIEARRLMLDEGFSATSAAFEVGYESVSQFTREYRRMFQLPPKRDIQLARAHPSAVDGRSPATRRPNAA
ncbi:MAG: hypothetical protein RL685_2740 [Pseudomonadota bacterium]|jgi:AraC-like DNA-binding protein